MIAFLRSLRHRSGLRAVLANTGWLAGEQVFRLLVSLFVTVLIARHLGVARLGELSYAIAISSVFGVIGTLGLNRILVRELVAAQQQTARTSALMDNALALRLLAAGLTYVACLAAVWVNGGQLLLVAIVAGSHFFSAADCIELYFQSRVRSRMVVRVRLLSFTAITLVRIALLAAGAGVTAFAVATLLEFAAAALALHWVYRRDGGHFPNLLRVDWKLARALLLESWPEILAGFSGLLFVRLSQVMLQHLSGAESVGIFAVAARLAEAWYFIPTAIVASTFPHIVRSRDTDPAEYMQKLQWLMGALCLLSYAVALPMSFLAIPLVRLLYGAEYAASAPVLAILVWSGLFVSLGLASGSWMAAEKRIRLNLFRSLAGLTSSVLLNLLLIPRLGVTGAAIATLLSLFIAYVAFDLLAPSMREISRAKWRALLLLPLLARR